MDSGFERALRLRAFGDPERYEFAWNPMELIGLNPSSALIPDVVAAFRFAGDPFDILRHDEFAHSEFERWIRLHFPLLRWGRIDWAQVPGARCQAWSDPAERVAAFLSVCKEERLQDHIVSILWGNALKPVLLARLEAVKRHAATIFEANSDTWIISPTQGWGVECYHEHELCFGRAINIGA